MKVPRKENSYPEVDMSKPINRSEITVPANDCFSREWDAYDKACQVCTDCDLCGILFSDSLKKKVHEKELEEKNRGAAFLDQAEMFRNVKPFRDKLPKLIAKRDKDDNPLSVEELIEYISDKFSISDEVAIKEWIKRFIKEDENISIKERKFRFKG